MAGQRLPSVQGVEGRPTRNGLSRECLQRCRKPNEEVLKQRTRLALADAGVGEKSCRAWRRARSPRPRTERAPALLLTDLISVLVLAAQFTSDDQSGRMYMS